MYTQRGGVATTGFDARGRPTKGEDQGKNILNTCGTSFLPGPNHPRYLVYPRHWTCASPVINAPLPTVRVVGLFDSVEVFTESRVSTSRTGQPAHPLRGGCCRGPKTYIMTV